MTAKKIIIAVIVAALAVGAIFFVLPKDKASDSTAVENPSDGGSGEQAGLPTYSMAEVATHKSKTDCWTVISGSVYDLTEFIPGHPGGDEILRACGIDGTTLFTQRETASGQEVGSGTPHSSRAAAELAELKIGELAQ
jgi:hypothetical protein